jgi:hypothetical protein
MLDADSETYSGIKDEPVLRAAALPYGTHSLKRTTQAMHLAHLAHLI